MKRHLFTGIMIISLPLLFLGGLGIGLHHRGDSNGLLAATSPVLRMLATPATGAPVPAAPDFLIGNRDQVLYFQCGNEYSAWYLENGAAIPPADIIGGPGTVARSNVSAEKFLLNPTYKTFTVEGIQMPDGSIQKIPVQIFEVRQPPKPEIKVWINSMIAEGGATISRKSTLNISIKADRKFKMAVRRDARFEFSKVSLFTQSGLGTPLKIAEVDGEGMDAFEGITLSLSDHAESLASGTKLIIQLGQIYRINYQEKRIPVNFRSKECVFTFKLQ